VQQIIELPGFTSFDPAWIVRRWSRPDNRRQ